MTKNTNIDILKVNEPHSDALLRVYSVLVLGREYIGACNLCNQKTLHKKCCIFKPILVNLIEAQMQDLYYHR